MDPQTDERKPRTRELDALEIVAEELEKLRILKEHELACADRGRRGGPVRRVRREVSTVGRDPEGPRPFASLRSHATWFLM